MHLKPGAIFGVDSVLFDVPYSSTAIGEDPISEIFFLKKEVLTELFYMWPHLHNVLEGIANAQEKKYDLKRQN